jgi:8-oxo-dGTP pyrophosphatase MutT (NUDIX family)
LSYLDPADIASVEAQFGKPKELASQIEMTAKELHMVRRSQHAGRAHDLTMFIFKDDKMLFIAKHFYPQGLFRAPSGAAKPGEGIIAGAIREAYEETGTQIAIERYILRIKVRFICGDDHIDWTSHVFTARYIGGEIDPEDKREIRAARFVDVDEIPRFAEIMRKSNIGGFHYRAYLTDQALKEIFPERVSENLRNVEMKSQRASRHE